MLSRLSFLPCLSLGLCRSPVPCGPCTYAAMSPLGLGPHGVTEACRALSRPLESSGPREGCRGASSTRPGALALLTLSRPALSRLLLLLPQWLWLELPLVLPPLPRRQESAKPPLAPHELPKPLLG